MPQDQQAAQPLEWEQVLQMEEELKPQVQEYWETNLPKTYRHLQDRGTWEMYLTSLLDMTMELYQTLINQGWNRRNALAQAKKQFLFPVPQR